MGLRERYHEEALPALMERFQYSNVMQVPRLEKVVVNMGVSDAILNPKLLDAAVNDLTAITGQRPVVTRAKKSIANFKLRAGMAIGCKVTLRGQRMYDFLDKLFNVALPRVRDFQGVPPHAFDGHGNYSLGLREQLIFPEASYDDIEKIRGMDVIIVTSAPSDEEAREMLHLLGMPFQAQDRGG